MTVMTKREIRAISSHANERIAQRNLTLEDIAYVYAHGSRTHNGGALMVHLGKRDIPEEDRRDQNRSRLEGTVLVLDQHTGGYLKTAYRNRARGLKDIKRKTKYEKKRRREWN